MKTLLALLVLSPCLHARLSAASPVPSPQVTGAVSADIFSGTWKRNLANSKYVGAGVKPDILKITAVPNGLTVVVDSVTPSETIHEEYTVKFDGRSYPYQRTVTTHVGSTDAVCVISAKKIDAYTFELDFTQSGKVCKA